MKTLIGSPPPEPEPEDAGIVYVVTTLGPSSDKGFVVNAEMSDALRVHRASYWSSSSGSASNYTVTWT